MGFDKGLLLGLALSVAVHVAATGVLAYLPVQTKASDKNEPIEISFVQYASSHPQVVRKRPKGIPVPRYPSADEAQKNAEVAQPSDFEKAIRTKIKKQEAELLRLSANTHIPSSKKPTQTSSELLTDPIKGKIFVGYFGYVKHAIQDLLVQKYAKRAIGHGSVYLFFVLSDKGALEKVSVVDRESTADEYLRELAVQCLRDAAPFGNFPQSLDTDRISFNVTIYFEER